MPCCQWQDDDLLLFVKIQPQASKDQLLDIIDNVNAADQIRIRISAAAVDGKANKQLQKFLADVFNVAKTNIQLLSGETSRNKKLLIKNPKTIPNILSNKLSGKANTTTGKPV